jgi:hypothetical protein
MNEERKAFSEERQKLNAKIAELEAAGASAQPASDLTEQLQEKEAQIVSIFLLAPLALLLTWGPGITSSGEREARCGEGIFVTSCYSASRCWRRGPS